MTIFIPPPDNTNNFPFLNRSSSVLYQNDNTKLNYSFWKIKNFAIRRHPISLLILENIILLVDSDIEKDTIESYIRHTDF